MEKVELKISFDSLLYLRFTIPELEVGPSFKFRLLCKLTDPPVAPRILDKSFRDSDIRKLDWTLLDLTLID